MSETAPRPLWKPPAALAAVAISSFALYNTAPRAVAEIVVFAYAASLVLGPALVYPWLRRRGATTRGAVLRSLAVPGLWLLKEGWRVGGVFGVPQALYYAFNPLSLGLFTAAAFQMAVAELVLRRLEGGRWEWRSRPAAVVAGIVALATGFGVFARLGDPKVLFYAYIALYRVLFGG